MEHILSEVVLTALKFIVIQTGRVLVWLTSWGHWRGEALLGEEGRMYGAAGALSFVRDGQRVITDIGLQFIGAAFYGVLLVVLFLYAAWG